MFTFLREIPGVGNPICGKMDTQKLLSVPLYFADRRSRRTTWQDPRFLPDCGNWDQRMFEKAGQRIENWAQNGDQMGWP